ncbi:MAG: RNA-binding protein [Gammaproteobacteria bacterium]|nr:RNA-binding protein [Gammaproteobacteria bacterium]
MEIYIGNIPKGTRPSEIKKLLKDSIQPSIFQRLFDKIVALGQLDNDIEIEIHTNKNKPQHKPYHYGQMKIKSDRIGPVALEALHNTSIRGSVLKVRKFVARNTTNDRRATSLTNIPEAGNSRRQTERRKHHLS